MVIFNQEHFLGDSSRFKRPISVNIGLLQTAFDENTKQTTRKLTKQFNTNTFSNIKHSHERVNFRNVSSYCFIIWLLSLIKDLTSPQHLRVDFHFLLIIITINEDCRTHIHRKRHWLAPTEKERQIRSKLEKKVIFCV